MADMCFFAGNKMVAWSKRVRCPFGNKKAAEEDSVNGATEERLHIVAQIYQGPGVNEEC
jgi:hypothetical protein